MGFYLSGTKNIINTRNSNNKTIKIYQVYNYVMLYVFSTLVLIPFIRENCNIHIIPKVKLLDEYINVCSIQLLFSYVSAYRFFVVLNDIVCNLFLSIVYVHLFELLMRPYLFMHFIRCIDVFTISSN